MQTWEDVFGYVLKKIILTPSFILLMVPALFLFLVGDTFNATGWLLLYLAWKLRIAIVAGAALGAFFS